MTQIKREALVMFSAKQMFEIVNDVEAYEHFLPNCLASKVIEQSEQLLVGRLKLGKGALNIEFTTQNQLITNKRIQLSLKEGPFQSLKGAWTFDALSEQACKVTFELNFQANALFKLAAKTLLTQMADQMVQCFIKRAEQLYSN